MFVEDVPGIASNYLGCGLSSMRAADLVENSFASKASIVDSLRERRGFERSSLYFMDRGAHRIQVANKHSERTAGLAVQSGNDSDEELLEFWGPNTQHWESGSDTDCDALRNRSTIDATER